MWYYCIGFMWYLLLEMMFIDMKKMWFVKHTKKTSSILLADNKNMNIWIFLKIQAYTVLCYNNRQLCERTNRWFLGTLMVIKGYWVMTHTKLYLQKPEWAMT